MKLNLLIICLIFVFSYCNNNKQKVVPKKDSANNTYNPVTSKPVTDSLPDDIDTTLIQADSARINGRFYTIFLKSDYTLYVVTKEDTIIKIPDASPDISFYDFNGDGFKDIRVTYVTNVPEVQEMLLFDKRTNTFKQIDNFSNFPAPNALKGTKYFYSYHKSGCADMNWDSDLFYIQHYKAIRIGNIAGRECDDQDDIYIHRIKGGKKILFKRLPITTIQQYKEYKWGFIKAYWTKNYKKFI
jgi:hypothetical protein